MSISAINSLPVSALDSASTRKLRATDCDMKVIAKGQEYWSYIVKLRPKFELKRIESHLEGVNKCQ